MKRVLTTSLIALTLVLTLSPVQAKEVRGMERGETSTALMIASKEANFRIRQKVAENHARRLEKRFDHYTERFEAIIARLNERIAQLETDGKDMADAKEKLAQAKDTLSTAKVRAAQAIEAFKAIEPGKYEEQKDDLLQAREYANQAVAKFKETFRLLRETIKLIKEVA